MASDAVADGASAAIEETEVASWLEGEEGEDATSATAEGGAAGAEWAGVLRATGVAGAEGTAGAAAGETAGVDGEGVDGAASETSAPEASEPDTSGLESAGVDVPEVAERAGGRRPVADSLTVSEPGLPSEGGLSWTWTASWSLGWVEWSAET